MAIVVEKYNIGGGPWFDGTWNKGGVSSWTSSSFSQHAASSHTFVTGPGSGRGGALRWKPHSHSDGRLAVLVSGGHGGTLTVNGVQGTYIGQTNGNRATYRFPKVGGAYGTQIKVEYSNGGTWIIPNGASDLKGVGPSAGSTKPAPKNKPADDGSDKPKPGTYTGRSSPYNDA